MNAAVSAAEKAAILEHHYQTTVKMFDEAAKQAILSHLNAQVAELSPDDTYRPDPVPKLRPFGSLPGFGDAALYGPNLGHAMDPRNADDDSLTEDDADEQARTWMLCHSETLADWIAKQCDGKLDPIRPGNPTTWEVAQIASVPHLLTLIVTGSASQIITAAHTLRDLYLDAHGTDIAERARELLAADGGAL